MAWSATKLRSINPAPISNIRESANSEITSNPRTRWRAAPLPDRPPSFNDSAELLSGSLQRRRQSEKDSGSDRYSKRPAGHAPIKRKRLQARNARRTEAHHGAHAPVGQQQSHGAAEHSHRQALGEELAKELSVAGAQRGANRHLVSARGGTRQKHMRHVRAGNQQHKSDSAEQRQECRADFPDDALLQWNDPLVAVGAWILLFQTCRNGGEFLASLLQRYVGVQAREYARAFSAPRRRPPRQALRSP